MPTTAAPSSDDRSDDRSADQHADRPAATGAPVRAVLYGRAGCHLCDEARTVVRAECAAAGAGWTELDVDVTTGDDGRPLADRYGELVPVVEVDGRRVGYWQIDPVRLREALRARLP